MLSVSFLPAFLLVLACVSVNGQGRGFRPGSCVDTSSMCPRWASKGFCDTNRGYMAVHCARSCDQCNVYDEKCRDENIQCASWADKNECSNNPKYMEANCAKSCAFCLPARDHSVPHIHQDKVRQFYSGNELNLDILERGGFKG